MMEGIFLHIQGVQEMLCVWSGLEVKVMEMEFQSLFKENNKM